MGSMTIGAKYKTTPKDPGTTGVLRMNEDRFTFTPNDPRSKMKLNADFRSIKDHKFNKVDGSKPAPPLLKLSEDSDKGGDYMFEFDNVTNRDLCRDFVLNELNEGISRSRRLNLKNPQESLLGRLPHHTRVELMDYWTAIQELLRHFWSSCPIATTVLYNKVLRVKDAMTQIYQKLQNMKESAAQPDVRHEISQLVKPMTQALDAAFNHDLDQQQKYSKAGNRPNGF